jgi:hypothetical protein
VLVERKLLATPSVKVQPEADRKASEDLLVVEAAAAYGEVLAVAAAAAKDLALLALVVVADLRIFRVYLRVRVPRAARILETAPSLFINPCLHRLFLLWANIIRME